MPRSPPACCTIGRPLGRNLRQWACCTHRPATDVGCRRKNSPSSRHRRTKRAPLRSLWVSIRILRPVLSCCKAAQPARSPEWCRRSTRRSATSAMTDKPAWSSVAQTASAYINCASLQSRPCERCCGALGVWLANKPKDDAGVKLTKDAAGVGRSPVDQASGSGRSDPEAQAGLKTESI